MTFTVTTADGRALTRRQLEALKLSTPELRHVVAGVRERLAAGQAGPQEDFGAAPRVALPTEM